MTPVSLRAMAVVLVVDLGSPAALWHTASTLLAELQARIDRILADLKAKDPKDKLGSYLRKKSLLSYGDSHPVRYAPSPPPHSRLTTTAKSYSPQDKDTVTPLVVPCVLVATKFDRLVDVPTAEARQTLLRGLRFLAHTWGASLLCTTDKDESSMSRARALFTQLAFKGAPGASRTIAVDPTRPLVVPVGADSYSQIGPAPATHATTA
jgi:dynein light intermediate chain 2